MAFFWLPVGFICVALARCTNGDQPPQPAPFEMSSSVSKNQMDVAKELLRLFNLHHVLASMNVSHSVRVGSSNDGSFVPSNPYWILMNHTQHPRPPPPRYAGNKTRVVKPAGHDVFNALFLSEKINFTAQGKGPRTFSVARELKKHSPMDRSWNSTLVRVKNESFVAPLPMEKFTFEDAPKSRPLLDTLQKESLYAKIERAKTTSSFRGERMHGVKSRVRSSEIDSEGAASEFKLQPAMRIITSPSSSVKHEIPVAFNHAFIVLGQPAERKRALASDYEVSVLGAVLGDLIDQSESGYKRNKTHHYKHVFNIGDKPVIQITEISNRHSEQPWKMNASALNKDVSSHLTGKKQSSPFNKVVFSGVHTLYHPSTTAPHQNKNERPLEKVITPRMGEIFFGTSASQSGTVPHRPIRPIPSYHTSAHATGASHLTMLNLESEHGTSQWTPLKRTFVKREVPSKSKGKTSDKAANKTAGLSMLLDDTNTIKPGKKWRGLLKPRHYETLNFTLPKLLPDLIFTTDLRGTPISSISPFDETPIGSVNRVVTIYGKKTEHKPSAPVAVVVAEGSQPPSILMQQQTSLVKRRNDEPDTPKPKYIHTLSDKFGERQLGPDRKDDYLLHKRPKGYRQDGEGRRPPLGTGRLQSPLEPKYDPEFERSRFLKPPPLFPERDRPPHHGRHPDDHPRHRDGPPFYRPPDRPFPGPDNGGPPYRPGRRPPPYSDLPGRGEGLPPREEGEFEEDLDPSRFDDYEAWRHLTRPPLPANGINAPFMSGFGGYPPFRGPPFLGGPGIGTILPGKKMEKFKYLLKGGLRGAGGIRPSFFGTPQGWYCPCNYYPPAGRFVTAGYPGFWGTMRGD